MQYINDLRKYVAKACGWRPGETRLTILGKHLDDDALQLSAGLMDAHSRLNMDLLSIHGSKVRVDPLHLSSLPAEVLQIVETTAPNVVMWQQPELMRMLLFLLDLPPRKFAVHREAYAVLARLAAFEGVQNDLRCRADDTGSGASSAARGGAAHALPEGVRRALCIPPGNVEQVQKRPGALLYALEVLYALMCPAASGNLGASRCSDKQAGLFVESSSDTLCAVVRRIA